MVKSKREPLNFKQMFDGWIDDTQKEWSHDRNKTLGSSEAFGCIRKAWYKRNGTPEDDDYSQSWGALRRGDIIENELVVPVMEWAQEKYSFEFLMGGEDQVTLFDTTIETPVLDEDGNETGETQGGLSVTPDGLIRGVARNALADYGVPDLGTDCFMLEVKSIDPRVDLSEEKAIHHGQTQIQMGIMRQETAFKPNYAVILYINASFLDDIEVFIVRFDAEKYQVAKDRAEMVFKTKDGSKLQREGIIDGMCQYCPFQSTCLTDVLSAMPDAPKKGDITKPELLEELNAEFMARRRRLKLERDKADKAYNASTEELKEVLRRHNTRKAADDTAGWSISYSMSQGRKTLSKAALKEDGIDVEQYMRQGNPYEVLRVNFKEMSAEDV